MSNTRIVMPIHAPQARPLWKALSHRCISEILQSDYSRDLYQKSSTLTAPFSSAVDSEFQARKSPQHVVPVSVRGFVPI
jgi:hypothetical protein